MAKKFEKFMTPFGTVKGFCAIDKPSTKFDENGVYSFNLEFAGKDAALMKKQIDKWMAESLEENEGKKSANPPYEINKEDKTLVVKFKLKAVILSRAGKRYEKSIDLYGPNGGKVRVPKRYAEGTVLRVSVNPYKWNAAAVGSGVTLQPLAIQFMKVVEFTPAAINEFEAVEGYEEATSFTAVDGQMEPAGSPDDDTDTDEGDDFDF